MKKYASIFLLSLYVFGATDAYQLLKLPVFIQHYITHKQQNPALSIAGFLQIHYNDGLLVVDDDFEQDMQLPFKTSQVSFGHSNNIIIPSFTPIHLFSIEAYREDFFNYKQQLHCLLDKNSIFQPPKAC